MAFKPKEESSTKDTNVYGCKSCEINEVSNTDRMCPCPRGGCEAEIVARKTVMTTVILNK